MPDFIELLEARPDWAVAVKPFGCLSEDAAPRGPQDDGEEGMPSLLRRELDRHGLPYEDVFPVHRLDRTTEGLMIYALTKKGASVLSAAAADGRIAKIYTAYITAAPDLPDDPLHVRDPFQKRKYGFREKFRGFPADGGKNRLLFPRFFAQRERHADQDAPEPVPFLPAGGRNAPAACRDQPDKSLPLQLEQTVADDAAPDLEPGGKRAFRRKQPVPAVSAGTDQLLQPAAYFHVEGTGHADSSVVSFCLNIPC